MHKVERLFPAKLLKYIDKCLREARFIVLHYDDAERSKVIDLINLIKREREMLLRNNEAYQLYVAVKAVEKVEGDIAEVGVYQGGSAKLICEAKGKKKLHLFDTFGGLPEVGKFDNKDFSKGQYASSLASVKTYLQRYDNVFFYKGVMPESAEPVKDTRFSLVHLDVDIYSSTRDCLQFFYPRLSRGGIILSHDFVYGGIDQGVRRAFIEFFKDKPEPILELSGSQCLVVKL